LHDVLSDAVGEERAAEFLPDLYRYLRRTPRDARLPISDPKTSGEAQTEAANEPAGGLVGQRTLEH
jgi:hypothetical protein